MIALTKLQKEESVMYVSILHRYSCGHIGPFANVPDYSNTNLSLFKDKEYRIEYIKWFNRSSYGNRSIFVAFGDPRINYKYNLV